MFTGLVQDLGRIVSIENHDGGLQRMTVQGRLKPEDLTLGASVSHSGVCLTVVATDLSGEMPTWVVEAVPETLAKTNLGKLIKGSEVLHHQFRIPQIFRRDAVAIMFFNPLLKFR